MEVLQVHFVNVLTSNLFPQKAKVKGIKFIRVVIKGLGPGRQVGKIGNVMAGRGLMLQHETVGLNKHQSIHSYLFRSLFVPAFQLHYKFFTTEIDHRKSHLETPQ